MEGLDRDLLNQKGLCDRARFVRGQAQSQSPEAADMALAYSEANNSLSGYCSLNSRNNLCARAFCFSRRAGRGRIIFVNGRRERALFAAPGAWSLPRVFSPGISSKRSRQNVTPASGA